jgi:transcription antitermination protein NusB
MPTGRRSARREAVFILYQQDLLGLTADLAMRRTRRGTVASVDDYARKLVYGVELHRQELDQQLSRHITGWNLERLGILERAILRVAAYELVWEIETPGAVVINEAVTLAKRFCSAEAGSFVNGVLAALAGSQGRTPAEEPSAAEGEHS